MTDHFDMIDLLQQYNEQRAESTRIYRKHTEELSHRYREARAAQIAMAKAGGHVVTVGLPSVARLLDVPVEDLRHDYTRTMPQWGEVQAWLIQYCQGRTVLFEPVEDSDDSDSAQHHTFAPAASQLKGSYKSSKSMTKTRMLNPGVLPQHVIKPPPQSPHPLDAALRMDDTLSAWFELPQDASLFKLTWS